MYMCSVGLHLIFTLPILCLEAVFYISAYYAQIMLHKFKNFFLLSYLANLQNVLL